VDGQENEEEQVVVITNINQEIETEEINEETNIPVWKYTYDFKFEDSGKNQEDWPEEKLTWTKDPLPQFKEGDEVVVDDGKNKGNLVAATIIELRSEKENPPPPDKNGKAVHGPNQWTYTYDVRYLIKKNREDDVEEDRVAVPPEEEPPSDDDEEVVVPDPCINDLPKDTGMRKKVMAEFIAQFGKGQVLTKHTLLGEHGPKERKFTLTGSSGKYALDWEGDEEHWQPVFENQRCVLLSRRGGRWAAATTTSTARPHHLHLYYHYHHYHRHYH